MEVPGVGPAARKWFPDRGSLWPRRGTGVLPGWWGRGLALRFASPEVIRAFLLGREINARERMGETDVKPWVWD